MARKARYTVAQIGEALEANAGIRSQAADALGCAPNTVKNYIDRHKSLQALEAEIIERNLDVAEEQIITAMKGGSLTACIFYLKTKGKHRGFTERHQVEGKDGGPVEVAAQFDFSQLSPAGLKVAQAIYDKLRMADADAV